MGRKICGTATSFGPACYNVNMYHAENMLQTSASKHAYRSKSYIAYIQKFAFHSSHNEKQINALYNQSTLLFESLPETRCSVNAIHTNACTEHLIPQMETGSDEAQKSPKHKVQGTTKPRPTWTIWESEKESRHPAAQIELEGEQTKDHAMRVVDVQLKANEMVEVGVRAIC